jgi:hypothetical protein
MLLRLRWIHAAVLLDRLARIAYVTTYYLRRHYPNAGPAHRLLDRESLPALRLAP